MPVEGELSPYMAGDQPGARPTLYGWIPRMEISIDSCRFAPLLVDGEAHPALEYDSERHIVAKRFTGAKAIHKARREFDTLERLSRTTAADPYLRYPEPVQVDEQSGRLLMSWCPGSQLHHMLAEAGPEIDGDLDHIGEQIAVAAVRYIREFDEPYRGLLTWNMLYDMPAKTLSLLDPLDHIIADPTDPARYPFEMTLGSFLGAGIYHTVRWRRSSWRNRAYWNRLRRISQVVVNSLDPDRSCSSTRILDSGRQVYTALVEHGRLRRRLWFATSGRVLFHRRLEEILGDWPH